MKKYWKLWLGLILAGMVLVMVKPGLLEESLTRLINELQPLVGLIILIGVIFYGLKVMTGLTGKKK